MNRLVSNATSVVFLISCIDTIFFIFEVPEAWAWVLKVWTTRRGQCVGARLHRRVVGVQGLAPIDKARRFLANHFTESSKNSRWYVEASPFGPVLPWTTEAAGIAPRAVRFRTTVLALFSRSLESFSRRRPDTALRQTLQ